MCCKKCSVKKFDLFWTTTLVLYIELHHHLRNELKTCIDMWAMLLNLRRQLWRHHTQHNDTQYNYTR